MRDLETLNELLEKYWEGETSLQEERALKSYFELGPVHPDHKAYAPLFQMFKKEQAETLEADLGAMIKMEVHNSVNTGPAAFFKTRNLYPRLRMIAAGLALLLTVGFIVNKFVKTDPVLASHEVEDPEEALRVTMDALAFLGVKLNEGTDSVNKNMKKVSSTKIFKN